MKLIEHKILIPLDDGKQLLVNSLNGLIDEIDKKTSNIIKRWSLVEEIIPCNEEEDKLLEELLKRGYIVDDALEEEKLMDNILSKLKTSVDKSKKIKENITLVLTYSCNFRCPYCFELDNPPSARIMTKEMVNKIFSMLYGQVKRIHLFGGEPLLPKTYEIVQYVFQRWNEVEYQITSNGYYLSEFIGLLKQVKIRCITVTLDGSKKTHDSRRFVSNGLPTYDKIINGVEKCLKNNIPIRIRMNVNKENLEECIEQKKILMETLPNADQCLSFEITPVFQVNEEERVMLTKRLISLDIGKNEQEMDISNHAFLSENSPLLKYLLYNRPMRPMYNYCYAHNNYLVFDPHGYIYPCITAVGKKHYSVGTYFPKIEYQQNGIYSRNIETIPECRKCKYALLCGGGCPLGISDKNNLYKPNCFQTMQDIYAIAPYVYIKHNNEFLKGLN